MKDKLLSVYVNDKEVYYVKRVFGGNIVDSHLASDDGVKLVSEYIDNYYGVFNSTNSEIAGYTLDINAYICAIELAMEEGKGSCVAVYPKEKRYFVNYEFVWSEEFA